MRSILFFVPHALGPLPIMGFGWALMLLIVMGIAWNTWQWKTTGTWKHVAESLPVWLMAGALIVFLFPWIETRYSDGPQTGQPIGLAIRGYGVMLMLGALSGVGLVLSRCQKIGISSDEILSLAFWSFIGGIGGARLFHVVQYWSHLPGATLTEKLLTALKFTEGGLVVYGGIIGGLISILLWCYRKKKPAFAVADLIVPGFMLGLCFGRIGCFMNGCCFGEICENGLPSVTFPAGSGPALSPAYEDQLQSGKLLGLELENFSKGSSDPKNEQEQSDSNPKQNELGEWSTSQKIVKVQPGSWAELQGIVAGQRVTDIQFGLMPTAIGRDPAGPPDVWATIKIDGNQILRATSPTLPLRTRGVHPSQLYSSMNALLLCLVLYTLWPITKRDGTILALGLILYGFSRILEEIIRSDEAGQFGTWLTISQWISVIGIFIGVGLLIARIKSTTREDFQAHLYRPK